MSEIAKRLRSIQQSNDWTVQEMADPTGLPKRSLENYMRKNDAQLPGVDALEIIAKGLGVSLDWLILGEMNHSMTSAGMVRLCARAAVLPVLQSISHLMRSELARDEAFGDGKLMFVSPEELAMEIAADAGARAEALAGRGVTSETWRIADITAGFAKGAAMSGRADESGDDGASS